LVRYYPEFLPVISVPNILLPFDIEQLEEEQEDTMVSLSAKRLASHSNIQLPMSSGFFMRKTEFCIDKIILLSVLRSD
jgi:hypothetical protein